MLQYLSINFLCIVIIHYKIVNGQLTDSNDDIDWNGLGLLPDEIQSLPSIWEYPMDDPGLIDQLQILGKPLKFNISGITDKLKVEKMFFNQFKLIVGESNSWTKLQEAPNDDSNWPRLCYTIWSKPTKEIAYPWCKTKAFLRKSTAFLVEFNEYPERRRIKTDFLACECHYYSTKTKKIMKRAPWEKFYLVRRSDDEYFKLKLKKDPAYPNYETHALEIEELRTNVSFSYI